MKKNSRFTSFNIFLTLTNVLFQLDLSCASEYLENIDTYEEIGTSKGQFLSPHRSKKEVNSHEIKSSSLFSIGSNNLKEESKLSNLFVQSEPNKEEDRFYDFDKWNVDKKNEVITMIRALSRVSDTINWDELRDNYVSTSLDEVSSGDSYQEDSGRFDIEDHPDQNTDMVFENKSKLRRRVLRTSTIRIPTSTTKENRDFLESKPNQINAEERELRRQRRRHRRPVKKKKPLIVSANIKDGENSIPTSKSSKSSKSSSKSSKSSSKSGSLSAFPTFSPNSQSASISYPPSTSSKGSKYTSKSHYTSKSSKSKSGGKGSKSRPIVSQIPTPTNTQIPTPTNTQIPTPTNTQIPTPTNTQITTPPNTQIPTPTNTQVPTLSFPPTLERIYRYDLGNCPEAGSQGVPCAEGLRLKDVCNKYKQDGSFTQCLESCKPSFCCIHDANPIENTLAPSCNTDENCAQYAYCYVVWWKLHDTIGPAIYFRVEQDDDFYDANDEQIRADTKVDVDNADSKYFPNQLILHHFNDVQTIVDEGTNNNGVFQESTIFNSDQFWESSI